MQTASRRAVYTVFAGALALFIPGLGASEPADVSFENDLVPVLKKRCAACHLTGQEPGNMELHPKAAYSNLVGVASVESKLQRVKPGDPDQSYLIMKLEGTHLDGGGSGVRMPLGAAPLDEETIQRFRDWVTAGAAEN